jgi:hypothetical protein
MNEYKGFEYTQKIPGWDESECMMYVDARPRYSFTTVVEMRRFIDTINSQLKISLSDFFLHISGCARCRRTYEGVKHDPCKTGVPKFVDGKALTIQLIDALLASWGQEKVVS